MDYALRPATTADYDFLYRLNKTAMRPVVEKTWGWDEAYQQTHFKQHFTLIDAFVITVAEADIGKLQVEKNRDTIFLASIQILPEYQRNGIGTAIIQTLMDAAKTYRLEITLQVLKANSAARRLYEKLGFITYGETVMHYLMRFTAPHLP